MEAQKVPTADIFSIAVTTSFALFVSSCPSVTAAAAAATQKGSSFFAAGRRSALTCFFLHLFVFGLIGRCWSRRAGEEKAQS